jgi:uncharacterized membrane protein (DUF106 family)
MLQDSAKRIREWQEIAAEAAKATDPEKLQQVTEELERALDQRDQTLHRHPVEKPDSKLPAA